MGLNVCQNEEEGNFHLYIYGSELMMYKTCKLSQTKLNKTVTEGGRWL